MKKLLFVLSLIALVQAQAGVVVIGNLARTVKTEPGGVFEGVIYLKNSDRQTAQVRVHQNDYIFQADGSNDYGVPGKAPRSNANWITLSPSRLQLAPGEIQPVRYRGTVPSDPKLRGTFWSMIMVEPETAPALVAGEGAVGLQTTIRFGIQIVTEIGKSATASLHMLNKSLVAETGKRALQLDIGNDGERLLIPAVSVELFGADGVSAGRFEAGKARIYPTCSVRARVDLTRVPIGKYTAMVLLDSGDAQVMGAQYDLEIQP